MKKNKEDIQHAQNEAQKAIIVSILFFILRFFFEKPQWSLNIFSIVSIYCFLVSLVFIISCYVPRPDKENPNDYIYLFWVPMAAVIYPYNSIRPYFSSIYKTIKKLKRK